MMINNSIPFNSPSAYSNGLTSTGGATGSFFQMAQLAMLSQMMSLLQMVMAMATGNGAVSGGTPQFGGGPLQAAPGGFLGLSGAGAGTPSGGASAASGAAASAPIGSTKDAGGGWVNPVGGDYRISSGFGPRDNPTGPGASNHKGVDMAAPLNTPIKAAKAGTVTISKDETTGYGKWIEIRHEDGTRSRYAHMNSRSVEVGARVAAGQQIGKMGSTGNSTGSHLHFEVLNAQGAQIDPTKSMKL